MAGESTGDGESQYKRGGLSNLDGGVMRNIGWTSAEGRVVSGKAGKPTSVDDHRWHSSGISIDLMVPMYTV